jgi:predicted transcriptional regulator
MKEVNGTIYYGTDGGKLFATKVNIAAGAVLSAFFYLFFRFFVAGAVARARGRLDSNDNRNVVLKFIADHPGSGLYDVSRGLGMNTGTARYHILVLSVNRRIVSFKPDGKHVRYFKGAFRPDERSIISLMRRDAMRRTLGALLRRPGLSNRELSRELDMLDSATARYVKELVERGIVENDPGYGERTSYFIKGEYREEIALMLERADGPAVAVP